MKKLFYILMIFFGLVVYSHAEILFEDDCEDNPSSSDYNFNGFSTPGTPTGDGDYMESSTDYAREGTHSYKFYLGAKQTSGYSAWDQHCALVVRQTLGTSGEDLDYSKEYWIGFSLFLPTGFQPISGTTPWFEFHNFHDWSDACDTPKNVPFEIRLRESTKLGPLIRAESVACGDRTPYDRYQDYQSLFSDLTLNTWHDIVVHFRLEHTDSVNGFFDIYLDGVLVVEDTGINAFNDTRGPVVHFGPYSNDETYARTIYIDVIRIGDENSSYAEVAPLNASPDTDPPIPSGFTPIGTVSSGTTSQLQEFVTNENATCRHSDTASTPWASMSAMDSGDGTQSHGWTRTGMSDGNTYTTYYKCQDSSSNESSDYVHTYSVDSSPPGQQNLLSISNYVSGSDTNTYTACYDSQYLYDGSVQSGVCYSTTGIADVTTIVREHDLEQEHDLTDTNLFGDDENNWQCLTWTFKWKRYAVDEWTTAFVDASCNSKSWDNHSSLGISNARFVRLEATGPAAGTQIAEWVLYGALSNPPASPLKAATVFSAGGAATVYESGGMAVAP